MLDEFRAGKIRICIGSTDKVGTGVDAPERVMAMHHYDIPWTPAKLEQRNGRGGRQGNWVAEKYLNGKVKTFFYGTKKTLDSYQFNIVTGKDKMIKQLSPVSRPK